MVAPWRKSKGDRQRISIDSIPIAERILAPPVRWQEAERTSIVEPDSVVLFDDLKKQHRRNPRSLTVLPTIEVWLLSHRSISFLLE